MTNGNDVGYEYLLPADGSAALEARNHAMILAVTPTRGGRFGAVTNSRRRLQALALSLGRESV